jgi:SAM-dependent methyltransferase
MWPDVVDLRDFYASSLGQVTRRLVRRQIRAYWTDTSGMNVLGIGFATPYLRPFTDEAARVTAVMPARMGVLGWSVPDDGTRNAVCLSDEGVLPFADLSMDRILVVHGLEYTEQVSGMLREAWRVLADGGRLMIVAPNRRGTWAHADDTPFGHGHPYSLEQLNRTLRQAMFTPVRGTRALFLPPTRRRFWLAAAPAWEKLGARWFRVLGGVVMVEAAKQIYAGTTAGELQRRRGYVTVPAGALPRTPLTSRDSAHK